MIRLKVYDVGPPYPLHSTPVLWLTDEQEEMVLILLIGLAEAFAIKSHIDANEETPPRPMTHDLLKSVFEHFDAEKQGSQCRDHGDVFCIKTIKSLNSSGSCN